MLAVEKCSPQQEDDQKEYFLKPSHFWPSMCLIIYQSTDAGSYCVHCRTVGFPLSVSLFRSGHSILTFLFNFEIVRLYRHIHWLSAFCFPVQSLFFLGLFKRHAENRKDGSMWRSWCKDHVLLDAETRIWKENPLSHHEFWGEKNNNFSLIQAVCVLLLFFLLTAFGFRSLRVKICMCVYVRFPHDFESTRYGLRLFACVWHRVTFVALTFVPALRISVTYIRNHIKLLSCSCKCIYFSFLTFCSYKEAIDIVFDALRLANCWLMRRRLAPISMSDRWWRAFISPDEVDGEEWQDDASVVPFELAERTSDSCGGMLPFIWLWSGVRTVRQVSLMSDVSWGWVVAWSWFSSAIMMFVLVLATKEKLCKSWSKVFVCVKFLRTSWDTSSSRPFCSSEGSGVSASRYPRSYLRCRSFLPFASRSLTRRRKPLSATRSPSSPLLLLRAAGKMYLSLHCSQKNYRKMRWFFSLTFNW